MSNCLAWLSLEEEDDELLHHLGEVTFFEAPAWCFLFTVYTQALSWQI